MSDILRGKALALVMERAVITDASGREVDLDALTGSTQDDATTSRTSSTEIEDLEELEAARVRSTPSSSDDAIDDEQASATADTAGRHSREPE